ncbi:MAG TPA: MobQ family relaxase [Steroidobacteraceae bacterium]
MAIFYLQISSISRGTGRRATAAAAYRSGERIRDERTGELFNHVRRRDILHTEIFLPSQFDGAPVSWARNRERLWNTAEHAEKRHNSLVAREFQVNLPSELDATRRVALARTFAREISDRYKVAVDLAVHEPPRGGDPRNFHAHLLATTREVTPAGLGAKSGLDMDRRERRRRNLPDHRQEYTNIRERWATLTNEALRDANIDARVDHRSLAAQGIDREPLPAIPLMHLKMEQRGMQSDLAEHLRAEYRERVARRLESTAARDPAPGPGEKHSVELRPSATAPSADVEEIRRRAREAWLQLRATEQQAAGRQSIDNRHESELGAAEREEGRPSRLPHDDFTL